MLLHGFDAIPGTLLGVAEALREALPGMTVRLGTGPVIRNTGLRAWWEEGHEKYPGAAEALAWLEPHLGDAPVVVAGFSQGGAMALACGFAGPDGRPIRPNVVAVVCVAGFLPDGLGDGAHIGPNSAPLFLAHGSTDEVVDVFHAESLDRLARRHAVVCDLTLHDGGHEWPGSVTAELSKWLARLDWG